MPKLRPFLRDVWRLSRPYYRSEEKWSAWGLLLSIVALRLLLVGMTVILSFWNREFFNSLQDKDFAAFFGLLFVYRQTPSGFMPGFCEIAAVYILVAVYYTYLSQWLQIRWRRWLTVRFLDEWLADRAYYRISLTTDRAAIGTDNPDQRIAEDIRDFVDNTLTLGISLLANVVTLFSFLGILWALSGTITLFGISIPGYMVWVALVYAVVGTWLTHLVGRPLAALRFRQQRVEADFRYSLVRVRENMEGIALYSGEAEEKSLLGHRFHSVIGNWWAIMQRTKMLNALTAGYDQVAVIFPFIVAAPRFFSGQIPLGGLTQTAGAFGRVQDALSWFIGQYASLAQWHAIVERLTTFHRAVVAARAAFGTGLALADAPDGSVRDARHQHRAAERDEAADRRRPCAGTGPLRRHHRPFGFRQVHLVPRARRHLAVRPRARAATGRALPVPAAAAVHSAGHAAARDHLSASARHLQSRGHRPRAGGCRPGAVRRRGWTTTSTGRSNCPAASSSASRWRGRCWRSRTGCSWTRRPPASIRRPRPSCIGR